MTTSFAELGLNEQILAGVDALGFIEPTPVQEQAIPLVLAGRDLVASAQTGTGKTAAFVLPTLQLIAAQESVAEGHAKDATTSVTEGVSMAPDDGFGADAVADGAGADVTTDGLAQDAAADSAAQDVVVDSTDANAAADDAARGITATAAATSTDTPARRRRRRRRRGKGRAAEQAKPVPAANRPAVPSALVITPTRELAQQIERVTTVVCERTGQRSVIVMGGARFDRQLRSLQRGCDLLVATPGRLIDLMDRHIVDLSHIRVLVLDEADRMLDMGFWPSVRRILQALPSKRQNLLFSATIPPSIKGTIDAMLTDPATVEIARVGQTADTVEEHLMPVTQGQKTQLLEALIRTGGADEGGVLERVLVFCRTKHRVDDVSKVLKKAGLKVEVMHADRRQEAREKALRRFREGAVQVLVATDVMSRGIDVSGIDAVVNYDVPMDPEDYVHRIGRTGRAGATGHAYTFMAPDEVTPLREIEYFTKKLISVWDLPGFAYDEGRIMPQNGRSTVKPTRTMFAGSRSRGRGPSGGRYGRHY